MELNKHLENLLEIPESDTSKVERLLSLAPHYSTEQTIIISSHTDVLIYTYPDGTFIVIENESQEKTDIHIALTMEALRQRLSELFPDDEPTPPKIDRDNSQLNLFDPDET